MKFNGTTAVFTVDSSGQITATVPNLATNGTLTVTNGYGTGTRLTNFTVALPPVLISQIYGGGGNNGATYKNDYVELYNRSGSPVSLTGWSIQYASASGTSWSATTLSGNLAAGKYYLVSLASGGATGSNLPPRRHRLAFGPHGQHLQRRDHRHASRRRFPTVTISATNAASTGSASLVLTINAAPPGPLFSENMGTSNGNNTIAIASNNFQNPGLTFTGTADVRNNTPSDYVGASGIRNVFITNTIGRFFEISGINTSGYTGLTLSVGHFKSTTAGSNELVIEVSSDGTTYTPLTYSRATGAGTAIWAKVTPAGTIPAVANLHIRFRNTNATPQFRVDDVVLSGTAVPAGNPTFGDWIGGFQVNGETGVNDDHDHDGLPNAIENILGTAPDVYSSGLTSVSSTANTLVFRHTRSNTIAPDLTASYEWPNLVDWNAAGASAGGITVAIVPVTITDTSAPDNDLVEVTATITGSSATQVFVRLKAVK